jgi:GNAT superfamily N-acetyltransferase
MIIDKWDREVINKLLDLYEEFLAETQFPVTANRAKARDRFFYAINDPDGVIIAAFDEDGSIMGGAVAYAVADWQDEVFGYVEKFFVSPRARGKGAGRMIADELSRWFDEKSAMFSFATSTANIGQNRQFENLMAKYGYRTLGPTLAREISHGKI